MSRYVWLAVIAVVAVTVGILLWVEQSNDADDAQRALPPRPVATSTVDGGHLWRPHLDRAGMRRKAVE